MESVLNCFGSNRLPHLHLPFKGSAFWTRLVRGSTTLDKDFAPLCCELCCDVVLCRVRDCLRLVDVVVVVVVVEGEETRSPL